MTVRGHAGKRIGDVQGSEWWGPRARLAARMCPWHHHFIPLFPLLLTALYLKNNNNNHSGDLLAQSSLLSMTLTGRFSSCCSTQSDSVRAGHCVHPPSSEPCSGRHGATGLVVCHSPSPILEAGGAQVEPQTLAPWSSSRAQPSHPHTMGSSSAGMSVQSTI